MKVIHRNYLNIDLYKKNMDEKIIKRICIFLLYELNPEAVDCALKTNENKLELTIVSLRGAAK